MSDLERRVKLLEEKVKLLEEMVTTLKNMQLSEQMECYIQSKTKTIKMMDLLNTVSDSADSSIDMSAQKGAIANIQAQKTAIDQQIATALKGAGTFSDDFPDDPRYFNYEVETGYDLDWHDKPVCVNELSIFKQKGIRITAYNGFDSDRIVVPKKINGLPVISIGPKAFENASFSELILPSSIVAICTSAFQGCKKLNRIDLPNNLIYLGKYAFAYSGISSLTIPDSVKIISMSCCSNCENLATVTLGKSTTSLLYGAFSHCPKLSQISLPESTEIIQSSVFGDTAIKTLILPSKMKSIDGEVFKGYQNRRIKVTCVFLGQNTEVNGSRYGSFNEVECVYCLPGSKAQQFARERRISMKPLNEFRMEDHI